MHKLFILFCLCFVTFKHISGFFFFKRKVKSQEIYLNTFDYYMALKMNCCKYYSVQPIARQY